MVRIIPLSFGEHMNKLLTASLLTSLLVAFPVNANVDTTVNTTTANTPAKPMANKPIANKPIPGKALAKKAPLIIPAVPQLDVASYMLMDSGSGDILGQQNADERLEPASLTKMMTAYVVDRAVASGKISLDQMVPVSEKAWRMEGSRMFINVNTEVSVRELLKGVIIQSGNDASVALAEFVAGSEEGFSQLMNEEASRLGMTNSHFVNATGLPAANHYSSAHDLAILGRALVQDFPESYPFYAEKEFTYNNIKQSNRNLLLWRDNSVDGIKTGFTDAAGYCLVSSAQRDGMRLIAVIMGSKSTKARAEQSSQLLTYGFRFYETRELYAANAIISSPRVWMGEKKEVNLGLADNLYLTIPRGQYDNIQATVKLNDVIKAPVGENESYGNLVLTLDGKTLVDKPLIALENVPKGSWWNNASDYVKLSFNKFWNKEEAEAEAENATNPTAAEKTASAETNIAKD